MKRLKTSLMTGAQLQQFLEAEPQALEIKIRWAVGENIGGNLPDGWHRFNTKCSLKQVLNFLKKRLV